MWMKVGMLPLRSSRVCSRTAPLARLNSAQGNSDRHSSMLGRLERPARNRRLCWRGALVLLLWQAEEPAHLVQHVAEGVESAHAGDQVEEVATPALRSRDGRGASPLAHPGRFRSELAIRSRCEGRVVAATDTGCGRTIRAITPATLCAGCATK
jgi:hypothetical protein